MQTFLPFSSFQESAKHLDYKRLVKQNLETKQILNTLCGFSQGWRDHPAVLEWKNYVFALVSYGLTIDKECFNRGFKSNPDTYDKYLIYCQENKLKEEYPRWIHNEEITSSHRSRLLCKGFIDALCVDLKRDLKIKCVDDWLKMKYGKSKNQLRYDDGLKIKADFPEVEFKTKNFYEQYGWQDDIRADYIWPI